MEGKDGIISEVHNFIDHYGSIGNDPFGVQRQ
jgi:hypothetical protein